MGVARQEWLDWEFDPPGFSQHGCDDIGDLLASGQISIEFLDDGSDDPPKTAAWLEENRLRHHDCNTIGKELRRTMIRLEGEGERDYEERLSWELTRQAGKLERQRAKERLEQGLPDLDHNPNAL